MKIEIRLYVQLEVHTAIHAQISVLNHRIVFRYSVLWLAVITVWEPCTQVYVINIYNRLSSEKESAHVKNWFETSSGEGGDRMNEWKLKREMASRPR